MTTQVQLVDVSDPEAARLKILERKDEIQAMCDATDPILTGLGGGFRDMDVRVQFVHRVANPTFSIQSDGRTFAAGCKVQFRCCVHTKHLGSIKVLLYISLPPLPRVYTSDNRIEFFLHILGFYSVLGKYFNHTVVLHRTANNASSFNLCMCKMSLA